MTTPKTVAEWMLNELKRETILCHEVVVQEISMQFGEEFTYTNANGDLAIDERVLREFRDLTKDMNVTVKGERFWLLKQ
jgi:hypothetical protein